MKLFYPVTDHTIEQAFGVDNTGDPQYGGFYALFDNKHPGVDFPVSEGTPVFSSFPGIVIRKEFHKGMGNVIGVRNGNIVILYAHLSSFGDTNLGDIVVAGQQLGLSGNTGEATTGAHLHFEMRDITKKELKDQVFNPPFGEEVHNLKETFEYHVDNTNTQKTLRFLSRRYFGSESYISQLWNANQSLKNDPEAIIENETVVVIPNY